MSGVNKVILVGHLGNEPEIRSTKGGTPVGNFRPATTERWTSKRGARGGGTEGRGEWGGGRRGGIGPRFWAGAIANGDLLAASDLTCGAGGIENKPASTSGSRTRVDANGNVVRTTDSVDNGTLHDGAAASPDTDEVPTLPLVPEAPPPAAVPSGPGNEDAAAGNGKPLRERARGPARPTGAARPGRVGSRARADSVARSSERRGTAGFRPA